MAAAARKVNWFAIWISAAVVVVLAVIVVFVVIANNAVNDPGEQPKASNIDSETGAIAVGTGSDTLDTYIDFMCPICNQFEQAYGETIEGAVNDGRLTLNIHPISILDSKSSGTKYSTRAASAMYCVAVAEPDKALPFMQAMYTSQPEEGSSGLTDDQIIDIAKKAGVTDASKCITDGKYMSYVTAMTPKTPLQEGATGIGTPTVVLNGKVLALTGDPQADIIAKLK